MKYNKSDKSNIIILKIKLLSLWDIIISKLPIQIEKCSRLYESPTTVMIEITNRCNLKCNHCARIMMGVEHLDIGDMTFENFKKILKQFPSVNSVILTGLGEPLLHPDLFNMIKYVKMYRNNQIHTFMSTNGTLLSDENITEIIKSGLDTLQISFDGAIAETNNKNRLYGANMFNMIIDNTKHLVKVKPNSLNVVINMVLQRENYKEASKMIELASNIGVPTVIFNVKNFAARRDKYQDYELYSSEDFLSEIEKAKQASKELGINLELSMISLPRKCNYLWDPPYVTWNGYLATCCTIPFPRLVNFGNLFEKDYSKLRNSKQIMEFRRKLLTNNKPDFCNNCHLY